MHVTIEIDGDTATVRTGQRSRPLLASRLIEAAGPGRAGLVKTVTGGEGLAFSVPVEVARAAGLIREDAPEPVEVVPPVEKPKPASKPRAKRSRRAAEPETGDAVGVTGDADAAEGASDADADTAAGATSDVAEGASDAE
ncbi:hypothetical protein SAMN05421776_108227 [Nocardia farcinica]|uniref:Uncharacterized protein n=1 Tax=Nocardia farcinica TaxID=37329 RepID=A0A0H5NDD9_NOCFR|nr:hypothetical protein [Nocardia farcinica]AXK88832.1 hypothetical protein DXT66_27270 [Nocardia farcinica]PFX04049.1 hypothetical protein CJ469_01923 [Nocardia farcinica]PFX10207.1 hypothetical protein CJ468_01054 [Nocardia farcinica]CRY73598.1 Uncharacterised protein [Nocardia farcinica]SIT29667.1 hypothetical protein SAMN05421776_108227 [Nocardia farcinica]